MAALRNDERVQAGLEARNVSRAWADGAMAGEEQLPRPHRRRMAIARKKMPRGSSCMLIAHPMTRENRPPFNAFSVGKQGTINPPQRTLSIKPPLHLATEEQYNALPRRALHRMQCTAGHGRTQSAPDAAAARSGGPWMGRALSAGRSQGPLAGPESTPARRSVSAGQAPANRVGTGRAWKRDTTTTERGSTRLSRTTLIRFCAGQAPRTDDPPAFRPRHARTQAGRPP